MNYSISCAAPQHNAFFLSSRSCPFEAQGKVKVWLEIYIRPTFFVLYNRLKISMIQKNAD